ncbi:hypothetical protein [Promicromonospora soli]|uniref:Uncharacterized protein n=1 Tax=Promicromonospora soli TaxID=2035533 RepID=A0A919FNR3_9MICO|nr:hypothetical protein [Promicromonospora soli]GHH69256.1 hypothetical protein GCM10017772_13930 [Promicromonospora soli]
MSGHDDLGFDADLGPGRDVLKQTIGALVDGATPRDVPSAPEVNLGLLRRRVRTWRLAKAGAVGLTTAIVVGALAFSTAQATTWSRSEPLPGRPTVQSTETGPVPSEIPTTRVSPSPTASASPTPSASPSETPDPVPSGAAAVEPSADPSASSVATDETFPITATYVKGYVPQGWLNSLQVEGLDAYCGMAVEDLLSAPDGGFGLEMTSGLSMRQDWPGWRAGTRLTGDAAALSGYLDPMLVWVQDGVVVDIPAINASELSYYAPEVGAPEGPWDLEALTEATNACAAEIEGSEEDWPAVYTHLREGGTFDVYAVMPVFGEDVVWLPVSAPVRVTLADGSGQAR